jgi:hypothetical protein
VELAVPDAATEPPDGERLREIRAAIPRAAGRAAVPLLLAAAMIWLAGARFPGRVALAIAGLVTLDLGLANRGLAPTVESAFYEEPPAAVRILEGERRPIGRVWVESPLHASVRWAPVPRTFEERSLRQRQAMMGYVGAAHGLDLAFPGDTEKLAPIEYTRLRVLVETAPAREKAMMLGAAGVTHLVAFGLVENELVERIAVLPAHSDPPQVLWRNRLGLPRARVVGTLLPYDGDAGFVEAVSTHPDDLFERVALVEAGELRSHGILPSDLPPVAWDGAPAAPGAIEALEDRGSRLIVRTRGDAGFLVVSDVLVPGWSATVDGAAAPLLRVDYAFRAVPLPAGEHEVVMRYRAW